MTKTAYLRIWGRLGIPDKDIRRWAPHLQREATRLVSIGRTPDRSRMLRLTPAAARAWKRMQAAAAASGLTLVPLSAYRSVSRQTAIIRRKLAQGQTIEAILRVNAVPGCSEHHTGRALDIGSPDDLKLEVSFAQTREFRWLRRHAADFGFSLTYARNNRLGIDFEPWHWCWRRG